MVLSIRDFQSAAAIGGQMNIQGRGDSTRIVNSNTGWLGRAVSWIKSQFASAETKAAQGRENQKVNDAFSEVMKQEFGSRIAGQVMQRFGIDAAGTKPLPDVRKVIAEAVTQQKQVAQLNAGFKVMYSSMGGAPAHPSVDLASLSDTQRQFVDSQISAKYDELSDGNRRTITADEAKKAAAAIIDKAVTLGDAGSRAVLDAQAAMAREIGTIGEILRSPDTGGYEAVERDWKFADALLKTKKGGETVADLQGRPLAGAEDTLAVLRGPIDKALTGLSRDHLQDMRAELTRPDGRVQAFLQGSVLDGDMSVQLATQRARVTIELMLERVGERLGLSSGERQNDLNKLQDGAATPSGQSASVAQHLEYRLTPKTYATDGADRQVLSRMFGEDGGQFTKDFAFYAATRELSPEYGRFAQAMDALRQDPSVDRLEDIASTLLSDMNVSSAAASAFRNAIAGLRADEQARGGEWTSRILEATAPLVNDMIKSASEMMPRFLADAALTAQVRT